MSISLSDITQSGASEYQFPIWDGSQWTPGTLAGTTNQVTVTGSGGTTLTLSLPQDIGTGSSPTFDSLTLTSPLTLANGGTGNDLSSASLGSVAYILSGPSLSTVSGSANQLLTAQGAGAPIFVSIESLLIGGTGVSISGTTAATIAIGQSVATTATTTFGTVTVNPGASQVGLTINSAASPSNVEVDILDSASAPVCQVGWASALTGSLYFLSGSLASGSNIASLIRLGGYPYPTNAGARIGTVFANTAKGSGSLANIGLLAFLNAAASGTMGSGDLGCDFQVQTTPQGQTTTMARLYVRNNGDIECNGVESVLSQAATSPFLFIPAISVPTTGTTSPTGTPTARTGNAAMTYDPANHKLWVYDTTASAWKGVVLT